MVQIKLIPKELKIFDQTEFLKKEQSQSLSFIFFNQGPPYCELGWRDYKKFNCLVGDALRDFKSVYGVNVYVYEYEIIQVEAAFLWGFGFFEAELVKRDWLSALLKQVICTLMKDFQKLAGRSIINNHDSDFTIDLSWGEHYCSLISGAEVDLDPICSKSKEKSYKKEDLDLEIFKNSLAVVDFKKIIHKHSALSSVEHIDYISAEDGFFSNKHRPNKYLREEFLPIKYFLEGREIPDSATIILGVEHENFDAKIIDAENKWEIVIEVTMGSPKNDHHFFSIVNQVVMGLFPLKTMAYLKKERDSLPGRIVEAIEKKHKKNYSDGRILMVVVQTEYTYQHEDYVIDEIIKEVRASVSLAKGNFLEIVMLCGKKIYNIF